MWSKVAPSGVSMIRLLERRSGHFGWLHEHILTLKINDYWNENICDETAFPYLAFHGVCVDLAHVHPSVFLLHIFYM